MSDGDFKAETQAARERLRMLKLGVRQAIHQAVTMAATVAEQSALQTTLFKDQSGKTRASIHKGLAGPFRAWVSAAGATRFLEWGTRPHVIPVPSGTLHFISNGASVFRRVKVVHHPGTAERPFMEIARREGQLALDYAADLFVAHAIRKHNGG
jgi:hypothetical protein